jgi:ABC-type branched-subunit amino acid transport system substrate-binding protein
MKRLFWCVLVALAVGCSSPAKPDPVWIGHLAPQSGPNRDGGEESIRAMQLVLEQAQADGFKVAGREVGVRHVDSASENARAEATRLLGVNRVVALIVGPGAGDVEELVAAARAHAAPVLILDEVVERPDYPGATLLGPDPARRGEEAAAHLARGGVKRVALLVDPSRPKYRAVADSFARHWKDRGELRRWEVADLKRPDALKEMNGYQPGAVVLAAPNGWCLDSRATLRATFPAKGDPPQLGFVGDDGAPLLRSPGRQNLGSQEWFVTVVPPEGAELPEAGSALLRRLGKEHNPPGRDAILALDGLRLVLEGLKKAGSPQRDKLVEALDGITEFEAVTGKLTWNQGRPVRPLFVVAGSAPKKAE